MTDREFDMLLKKSAELYGDSYYDMDAPEHTFSADFNKKMDKLIRRKNNSARIIRIFAGAAAVIIIGAAVGIFAIMQNNSIRIETNTAQMKSADDISSDNKSTDDKSTIAEPQASQSGTEAYNNDTADNAAKSLTPDTFRNGAAGAKDNTDGFAADQAPAAAAEAQDENEPAESPSAVVISVTRRGEALDIGEETAGKAGEYISALISGSAVSYDTEESNTPIADPEAEYSFILGSSEGYPAAGSYKVNLLDGRGCVIYGDPEKVYSFTIAYPQAVMDELKDILG